MVSDFFADGFRKTSGEISEIFQGAKTLFGLRRSGRQAVAGEYAL